MIPHIRLSKPLGIGKQQKKEAGMAQVKEFAVSLQARRMFTSAVGD